MEWNATPAKVSGVTGFLCRVNVAASTTQFGRHRHTLDVFPFEQTPQRRWVSLFRILILRHAHLQVPASRKWKSSLNSRWSSSGSSSPPPPRSLLKVADLLR